MPRDIVVMDNMRSHHVKTVREVLEEKGIKVLYLQPYSPGLNPIEKMWFQDGSPPSWMGSPKSGLAP